MFAIIRTRWQTRPLSPRAKRRSSAAPGSLRKKYAGIAYPPNMVRLPNHSTTSGDPRKPVLLPSSDESASSTRGTGSLDGDFYAPVGRPALRRVVRGDRVGLAEAFGRNDVGVDPLR